MRFAFPRPGASLIALAACAVLAGCASNDRAEEEAAARVAAEAAASAPASRRPSP
jgi:hypothetical protein